MIELRITRCNQTSWIWINFIGGFMHNLMSFNQLASWKEIEMSQENDRELVNDYFNCLIECEDDQSSCKTICKDILM